MTWWSMLKSTSIWPQDYRAVRWKLFRSVDAKSWTNVLAVTELLVCLPAANGRLERVSSQLKLIKTNQRICLSGDALDHPMGINAEGPPLSQFDAAAAVTRWWKAKQRRLGGKETPNSGLSISSSTTCQSQPQPSSVGCLDQ